MSHALSQTPVLDVIETAFKQTLNDPSYYHANVLEAIYKYRLKQISFVRIQGHGQLPTKEQKLTEIAGNYLVADPKVMTASEKSDLEVTLYGDIPYLLKMDTGAITSVLDAENIVISGQSDTELIKEAYEAYVKINPDKGAMTYDDLKALDPKYHHIQFGYVENFDLVIYENGHDDELDKKESRKDEKRPIHERKPVVAISCPKVKGERGDIRPVIEVPVLLPGEKDERVIPFALTRRKMTRRGLASRKLAQEAGIIIIFSENSPLILDPTALTDQGFCLNVCNALDFN